MSSHESFIKAIRVEPNEPFHERVYGDFLRDEGYDPPDDFIAQARELAPLLHASLRAFRMPNLRPLTPFGLEVLLGCTHLRALRELHLMGQALPVRTVYSPEDRSRRTIYHVVPNVGEAGLLRLARSPLIEQITYLDVRFNNLGAAAIAALASDPAFAMLDRLLVAEPEQALSQEQWAALRERYGDALRTRPDGAPKVP
jgi:hypothetical protein